MLVVLFEYLNICFGETHRGRITEHISFCVSNPALSRGIPCKCPLGYKAFTVGDPNCLIIALSTEV